MGKIKFEKDQNLILVDAILIGKETDQAFSFKLALDTGAAVTTISSDMLTNLGYNPRDSKEICRLITADDIQNVPLVKIRKIAIGDEPVENLEVYCHNFPTEDKISGVIGLNYLRYFNIYIDFDSGEITLDRRK